MWLRGSMFVRPARAEVLVQRLLAETWVHEVIALEARGFGRHRPTSSQVDIDFLTTVQVECVIDSADRERLLQIVYATCRTGRLGDGKILFRACTMLD